MSNSAFTEIEAIVERIPTDSEAGHDVDALLEALSDGERRHILAVLEDEGSIDVDDLVACVATDGSANTLADGSGRTAMRFHHVHLPKLNDVGLIDHDYESDVVALTDTGARVADRIAPVDARGNSLAN